MCKVESLDVTASYFQSHVEIWNVKTTRIPVPTEFVNVDPEQVSYVMPNLSFPCVQIVPALVAR